MDRNNIKHRLVEWAKTAAGLFLVFTACLLPLALAGLAVGIPWEFFAFLAGVAGSIAMALALMSVVDE
jgi:hypothetical protein